MKQKYKRKEKASIYTFSEREMRYLDFLMSKYAKTEEYNMSDKERYNLENKIFYAII